MSDVREAPAEAPIAKPAKAWDNWWHFVAPIGFPVGTKFRMGPHPSQDLARTRAKAELNSLFARTGMPTHAVEYLGAFPEGERP